MALKDIKNKIRATERTHKVTRAMEAVSAVKMRKTQGSAIAGRPYARAALSILARLSGSPAFARHPLMRNMWDVVRPTSDAGGAASRRALLVITSDKGLAGALTSNVLRAAALLRGSPADTVVYAYGRKGEEFFRRRGFEIRQAFENKRDDVERSVVEALARDLIRGFAGGEFRDVVAVYTSFKSTFEQAAEVHTLLPLSVPAIERLVREILPAKGKFSQLDAAEPPASYVMESRASHILDTLAPRLVADSLYHLLLESKASEHSARMVAMKNASDKSKEIARDLTRRYNKIRQAAITREVSEIVGGREALAA